MAFAKVIAFFNAGASLERAKAALTRSGLATEATMRVEQEFFVEDLTGPPPQRSVLERLKDLLPDEPEERLQSHGDHMARSGFILVVTTPEEQAGRVRELLDCCDSVEMTRALLDRPPPEPAISAQERFFPISGN